MSHDRGCYCGRERYEQQDCREIDCPRLSPIERAVAKAGALHPAQSTMRPLGARLLSALIKGWLS